MLSKYLDMSIIASFYVLQNRWSHLGISLADEIHLELVMACVSHSISIEHVQIYTYIILTDSTKGEISLQ